MRHVSPGRGGSDRPSPSAIGANPAQGTASSTVQPRSVSDGSFNVPSTKTAADSPGRSQPKNP